MDGVFVMQLLQTAAVDGWVWRGDGCAVPFISKVFCITSLGGLFWGSSAVRMRRGVKKEDNEESPDSSEKQRFVEHRPNQKNR